MKRQKEWKKHSKKTNLSKTVWQETPIYENGKRDKYTDGFENIGDVSRARDKSKESNPLEFITTSKDDAIGHSHHVSQSLRTKISDNLLKMNPVYDFYSKNQKLKNYKEALVKTKAMDHVIPFNHSESIRGQEFKQLRPSHGKLYPKSAKMMIINANKEAKERDRSNEIPMLYAKKGTLEHQNDTYDVFDSK